MSPAPRSVAICEDSEVNTMAYLTGSTLSNLDEPMKLGISSDSDKRPISSPRSPRFSPPGRSVSDVVNSRTFTPASVSLPTSPRSGDQPLRRSAGSIETDYCSDDALTRLSSLDERALQEIEELRRKSESKRFQSFPPACYRSLQLLPGNQCCMDCGVRPATWAAVSYGALLCLQCSGHHRSLGVNTSVVRSLTLDEWHVSEILSMLEGGNTQLTSFFQRHCLTPETYAKQQQQPISENSRRAALRHDNLTKIRYKTKAALFYRQQLQAHVQQILDSNDTYSGRHAFRQEITSSPPPADDSSPQQQ
jgi:Putative GTPase activating protein for Arf